MRNKKAVGCGVAR